MDIINDLTKKDRKTRIIALIFLGAFILIVLSFVLDIFILPAYTRQWQNVQVPDVSFTSMQTAQAILHKKGLDAVVGEEKYDSNYPPGYIIFQNPAAQTLVKKGRRIYLTIGKGKQIIEMPDIKGISERDARFILQQNQLQIRKNSYQNDDQVPVGVIIEQSVPAGRLIEVDEMVDFTLSLGLEPDNILVPSLVGKSREEAVISIKKAGLTLGLVQFQLTDKILPNTVVSQTIASGTRVSKDDTLGFVLSKLPGKDEDNLQW